MSTVRKVLVTGGAGFIGGHLAELLLSELDQVEVVILDNLSTGSKSNVPVSDRINFIEGDIRNRELIERVVSEVELVFHLAAMVSVSESVADPFACLSTNVEATLSVLEAARKSDQSPKVVFSSSCAVYGEGPKEGNSEELRPQPKTPYGISKLDGEFYLDYYREQFGVASCSLRYFNVFGPRQNPNTQYAAVVPKFIQCAEKNAPMTIFGDGSQVRDFVYVKDVAKANLFVAQNPEAKGVYNVASGKGTSIADLAETIREVFGSTAPVRHEAPRTGDIHYSLGDPSRLQSIGFKPSVDIAQGLTSIRSTLVGA